MSLTTALILGLCLQNALAARSSTAAPSTTTTTTTKPPKAEKRQSFEQYYVDQDSPAQQYLSVEQDAQPQQQYFRASPQITPNQLSPEYVRLLQQLENPQVETNNQQIYLERGPQQFTGSPQRVAPQLTVEQENHRQLQESIAQRGLREQEVRDARRFQQTQYQTLYQPETGFQPSLPPSAPVQAFARPSPSPLPQYIRAPVQPQYASSYRVPERVSYSHVQLGASNLPRQSRLVTSKPPQQIVYANAVPAPQPQQVYRQEAAYDDSTPIRPSSYQSDSDEYQKPVQQFLVETSHLDQPDQSLLALPKGQGQSGQVYYTTAQQPSYQIQTEQQQRLYGQHQQQYEAQSPRPPIYVAPARLPGYRVEPAKSEGRPLTMGELRALIDAGFRVQEPAYGRPYDRDLSKRQNRLITRPVQLSPSERREYERHGIRNVYRVEPAESQETPSVVRYVLAIGPPMG